MITLTGQSDQLQSSSETAYATRREAPDKKRNLAPESGFDVLFSSLAVAPQMIPALQQRPDPSENTVYEPCNAPDDSISASKAPACNNESRDALREKLAPTAQEDAARNETAPARSEQTQQADTQSSGNANAPVDAAQTAEKTPAGSGNAQTVVPAAAAGMQGTASLHAAVATQPTFETTLALVSDAVLTQSTAQTPQTDESNLAAPKTANNNLGGSAERISGKQAPVEQTGLPRNLQALPLTNNEPAPPSPAPEAAPETKTAPLQSAAAATPLTAEQKAANQISEARSEAAFKELISAIKVAVTAGPASQDTSSFSPGFGENTGSGSTPHMLVPAQGENSFSQLLNRDATQLIMPAGAGDATQVRAGQRTESAVSVASTRLFEIQDTMVSKAALTRDGNQLALTLKPEGLGKLDINISLEKGMLHAQIHASDPAAKQLIENNLQQIVNTLMQEGLTVSGFSVSLRQGAPENRNGSGLNAFQNPPEKAFEAPVVSHMHDQNSMISIFV